MYFIGCINGLERISLAFDVVNNVLKILGGQLQRIVHKNNLMVGINAVLQIIHAAVISGGA